jgi:hypothetical protein
MIYGILVYGPGLSVAESARPTYPTVSTTAQACQQICVGVTIDQGRESKLTNSSNHDWYHKPGPRADKLEGVEQCCKRKTHNEDDGRCERRFVVVEDKMLVLFGNV